MKWVINIIEWSVVNFEESDSLLKSALAFHILVGVSIAVSILNLFGGNLTPSQKANNLSEENTER